MKTASRITRSQPQGHVLPHTKAKQNLKKTPKMTTVALEATTIPAEARPNGSQEPSVVNEKIDALTAANERMEETIKRILDELRSVQNNVCLMREENTALKAENSKLRKDIEHVYNDMDFLFGKVERMEQKNISKNVEISGVPALQDEDLDGVLQNLFREVNYESSASTMTDAYRLKENNRSGLPGPIIVTFKNNAAKDQFLDATKKKPLTSSFLSTDHRHRPVYINDHLTRLNKYLFYLARTMRRQGHVKYAWTDNGRVLVKQADGTPAIFVECPKTLDNLKSRTEN
jgi:regulator of replication initiation timing